MACRSARLTAEIFTTSLAFISRKLATSSSPSALEICAKCHFTCIPWTTPCTTKKTSWPSCKGSSRTSLVFDHQKYFPGGNWILIKRPAGNSQPRATLPHDTCGESADQESVRKIVIVAGPVRCTTVGCTRSNAVRSSGTSPLKYAVTFESDGK